VPAPVPRSPHARLLASLLATVTARKAAAATRAATAIATPVATGIAPTAVPPAAGLLARMALPPTDEIHGGPGMDRRLSGLSRGQQSKGLVGRGAVRGS
jgi:hypothetical protein